MWADPTRIRQVFWNLLTNAAKFTPPGGAISIRSENTADGRLILEISDNGIGIEPDKIARVFNAFEQAERSVTRQFGGLGLGLAITRSLVQMHHGTITARSEGLGKGASFQLSFAAFDHAGAAQVPAPVVLPPRALCILLAEDHEDTRRILARLLEKYGHRVETVEDVASATRALETVRFDVLISDIGLPDGNGYDLLQRATAVQPHLTSIALSGYGMENDLQRSAAAGFSVHLTKPVDIDVLQAHLLRIAQAKSA
jgi:hypothetical protein